MLQLTFKQTQAEMMVRSAATILFNKLLQESSIVELSELAESPQYGLTTSATSEPVGPKFIRITDLKDGGINWETVPFCRCEDAQKYALKTNDILFARTGATTGKTHLVQEVRNAVFASYLIRLRPKKEVSANYLYSFFQSDLYWSQILEEKKGSAQPNVNGKKLLTIRLPIVETETQHAVSNFLAVVRRRQDGSLESLPELPPPIAEQRQIVARIEELAAKIEEARGLRESAIKELSAIVSAEKNSLFCNDFFAKYPNKKLGEIADIRAGVTLGRKLEGKTITLPYLRVANVQDGYLDLDSLKEVEIYELELEKWLLKYGDLLLTEGGDWDKLGRGTVWRSEIPGCIHQNHIFRLRVDLAEFMPEFLSTLISSPHGKEYFQGASKQTTNLATINQRQLKAFQIAQPPMEEQERIVNFINDVQTKVEEMKRLREDALKEFDAFLPAILDKAFKGEL